MRLILFLTSSILLFSCHERKPANVRGITVPVELLEIADGYQFDYTGKLSRAIQKDEGAVLQLFDFSVKTDSMILQQHGRVLLALLDRLGDEDFSQFVGQSSIPSRQALWRALERGKTLPVRDQSPKTWQALLPDGEIAEHRGLYIYDRKMSTFRDCSEPAARYVAIDETGEIERNYLRLLGSPYPEQPIYVEVNGYRAGYFGDKSLPSNYEGFFIVTGVVELEAKNFRNNCIPYEVWAIGTEPFWSLQISSLEDIIEFREADKPRVLSFPYVEPSAGEEPDELLYPSLNETTGDNIRITVRPETCSDGMSDETYPMRLSVTVNGRTFEGCGKPFQAAAKTED